MFGFHQPQVDQKGIVKFASLPQWILVCFVVLS